MQCQKYFLTTPLCRTCSKTNSRFQNHKSASILSKIMSINLLFDLEQMAAILDFCPQCLKCFVTAPLCRTCPKHYSRHQNHKSVFFMSKIIYIYCLSLHKWQTYWILPYFFFNIECLRHIPENPLFEKCLCQISSFYVNFKNVFS